MADEKIYTIPLREVFETDRRRRAKKAVIVIHNYLVRHMKLDSTDRVKIGASINNAVWARGIQKPPRRVKVHAVKNEEGNVFAEMVGTDIKAPTKEELKKKAEKLAEKKKKLKEERKERKQKPVEEEAKEEKEEKQQAAGRAGAASEASATGREKPIEEKPAEKPEEKKEEAPKEEKK